MKMVQIKDLKTITLTRGLDYKILSNGVEPFLQPDKEKQPIEKPLVSPTGC